MGSTVFFQAQPGGNMTVTTIEGAARVEMDDEIETAIAGTQVNIPIDENLLPISPPEPPVSYDEAEVIALPIDNLERDIEIAPPLSEDELNLFLEYETAFESIDINDQDELLDYLITTKPEDSDDVIAFLTNELGYDADVVEQPGGDEAQPTDDSIEESDQPEISAESSDTAPNEENASSEATSDTDTSGSSADESSGSGDEG
jgi:hypothetical protein